MTGPVLRHLGETKLDLGPAREAPRDKGWRAGRDDDGIAWLLLDVAGDGPNTVSEEVLAGLSEQIERLKADPPAALVLRSAKTEGFAVGADIGMLEKMTDPETAEQKLRQGHEVLDALEALSFPTIAVSHGPALGGGFEIILACDRCIAVDGASFGFPEVNLGLHPGLGGTFRLPERIDATEAMTLMLTGKTAHTKKARKLGIADVVTQERHVGAAVRDLAHKGDTERDRSLTDRAMALAPARAYAARQMRSRTAQKASKEHYPAPYALIDLWEEHHDDRTAMQQGEIRSFARLLATDTAQELIRVFHLRGKLKDQGDGEDGVAHVHVAGAGAMGAEIAAWAALKGKRVSLFDPDIEALGQAVRQAQEICDDAHCSALETRDTLDRMMPDPDNTGAAEADLVIEAGPEAPEIKGKIYADLEPRMKSTATLATNTSSLSLDKLAEGLRRPKRFAGLHFFNPVPKMPLVEVVRHAETYGTVSDQLARFCGAIGKLPARVANYPGFLVNRALTPYLLEALVLVDEGVPKETIDRAAEDFGMPTGPVELADYVGLDICLHVADSLKADLDRALADVPGWFREKVEDEGEVGKKSGKGLYIWEDGEAQKNGEAAEPEAELTDRLILPMLDACVECLRREVVQDADHADAAMIFGAGFAPFRGGPMRHARARGIETVTKRLSELEDKHGARFAPDVGWTDLGPHAE